MFLKKEKRERILFSLLITNRLLSDSVKIPPGENGLRTKEVAMVTSQDNTARVSREMPHCSACGDL